MDQASAAVVAAAIEWQRTGDALHLFMRNPNFAHTLSDEDKAKLTMDFHQAVDALHVAVTALNVVRKAS